MIKKLTRHGNSLALVIDRPVLELLNIHPETPLSVTTDGRILFVAPVTNAERKRRLKEAIEEGHRKYGRMLKRLAD